MRLRFLGVISAVKKSQKFQMYDSKPGFDIRVYGQNLWYFMYIICAHNRGTLSPVRYIKKGPHSLHMLLYIFFWLHRRVTQCLVHCAKAICTRHASSAVRLRQVRWVQCAVVCTHMKWCVRCIRPGLNEWFRPEIRRWRWCAAVQDGVLLKFWHHKWHF